MPQSPCATSYGVYIALNYFARASNQVSDFNNHNKTLTAKLLKQGYRNNKLHKTFSKFYCRHCKLMSKYNIGLKTLLQEGLSKPKFYGLIQENYINSERSLAKLIFLCNLTCQLS